MRTTRIRTISNGIAGGVLLGIVFLLPATGHCDPVNNADAIAASSAPAAPAPNTLLLIAAVLAFPAAMLSGAFLGPRDHSTPSGLE